MEVRRHDDRTDPNRHERRRGDDPLGRPRAGYRKSCAARRRDRLDRRVPVGRQRAVRAERSARYSDSRRIRGARRHVLDVREGRRGNRQSLRVERADRRRPGARNAADRHRRKRRTEAAVSAEDRLGRASRRLRADGSLERVRRARLDAHARREAGRHIRSERPKDSGSPTAASPTSCASSPSPIPPRDRAA